MSRTRPATPTVAFIDQYCAQYRSLFHNVRHFEQFTALHLGLPAGSSAGIGHIDGLRRGALCLQERVGYPVSESKEAGSRQCQRQGAAPPDGVG